jgi:hypothetical protein
MNAGTRHDIDDTDQIRPHVRLCHQILRDGITTPFAAVHLSTPAGAMPTARVQTQGKWEEYMAFPPPLYGHLVAHFRDMAGVAPEERDAEGTVLVRLAGRDASIRFSARRTEAEGEGIVLTFPVRAAT